MGGIKIMDNELFRKQYDFELEQRNSLASAANIPIMAITILASAISAILIDYKYNGNYFDIVFFIFVAIVLFFIFRAFLFVFRSFWNYDYKKLPSLSLMNNHYYELIKWHENAGFKLDDAKKLAYADFSEYINERLSDASDWNSQNNIARGNYLHVANLAVAIGVAILIPTGLMYVYNKLSSDEDIYQVKVLNFPIQNYQEKKMSSSSSNNKPVAPAATPTPTTKPSGPPNVVFKSNSDMPKPTASNTKTTKE